MPPLDVKDTHMAAALPSLAHLHKSRAVTPLGDRSWQSSVVVVVVGPSGCSLTP